MSMELDSALKERLRAEAIDIEGQVLILASRVAAMPMPAGRFGIPWGAYPWISAHDALIKTALHLTSLVEQLDELEEET